MRFTIEGLNQEQLVAWKLDATDAVLLRWFADWYLGTRMQKVDVNGKAYGWLQYRHVADELPCLGIKNPDSLARRFKKYITCGLMEIHVRRIQHGSRTFFHLVGEKWSALVTSTPDSKVACESTPDSKVGSAPDFKVGSDSSSIDSKSTGVPVRLPSASPAKRKENPQSRLIALFFELYRKKTGKDAPWTRGKDHALLADDLRRLGEGDVVLGEKRLSAELRAIFETPPPRMSSFRYATVHVFLSDAEKRLVDTELAYSKRLRLLKTCKACGKASETTGIDCPKCGEPDAYQVREARHA